MIKLTNNSKYDHDLLMLALTKLFKARKIHVANVYKIAVDHQWVTIFALGKNTVFQTNNLFPTHAVA